MSIAKVGETGIAGSNTGPVQEFSYASTDTNTLVLVGLFYNSAGAVCDLADITDSAGNRWDFAAANSQDPPSQSDPVAGQRTTVFIAWCIDAAEVSSVTVERTDSGSNWWRVTLAELSGVGGLDSSAGTTSTDSASASADLTLTDPGSIVLGSCNSVQAFSPPSLPAGWNGFDSSGDVCNAYAFPGITGSYAPAYTFAGPTDWALALAAFKPAGAATVSGTASLQGGGSLTTAAAQQAGAALAASGSLSTLAALQAAGTLGGQGSLTTAAAEQAATALAGSGVLGVLQVPQLGWSALTGQGGLTDATGLAAGTAVTGRGTLTGTPRVSGRTSSGLLVATFP